MSNKIKRYSLSELEHRTTAPVAAAPRRSVNVPGGFENILLKDRPKITQAGGRSAGLYHFALRCRDFGYDEPAALVCAKKYNELYCEPPEPDSVVEHQTSSAYKYAKHPAGRYLSERPERMAVKFDADAQISERLQDFIFVAEAEILINTVTGLRYTKASQIENALCYATGVKTTLNYVLTYRLVFLRDRLAFRPDSENRFEKCGISYHNTFEPIQPVEKTKVNLKAVKRFEEHLKYLTNTDEEFQHLRKFLACAFLRPGKKIKHALLLVSTYEGIGKSILQMLAENILRSTRDSSYVVTTSNTEIARGNNSWIESKFLTFVHELGQSEKYAVLDQIKNWITEPSVRISDKYVRSYEIENLSNFMFFSNAVNALPVGGHERRFFVVVNRRKPLEPEYYERLIEVFEKELYSIVSYLERYADALNVNAPPPVTESKMEMRGYSKNELTLFLDDCANDPDLAGFFESGFTIRELSARVLDSIRAANVKFSQKGAAIWLRENNFILTEKRIDGHHVRRYLKQAEEKTNVHNRREKLEKRSKIKPGKKTGCGKDQTTHPVTGWKNSHPNSGRNT